MVMDDSEGDGSFLIEWDYGGPPGFPCSIWDQDCGPDDKCMPWADDGGDWWNWWRCSPVVEDAAAVGEACMVLGSPTGGVDTCDAHSMCWDVNPATSEGHCVAFCEGDQDNPLCDNPDEQCLNPEDQVLVICLPACDPLLQDCSDGNGCYPTGDWPDELRGFVCVPERLDAAEPGAPCDLVSSCEAGSLCVHYEYVPGCEKREACCVSYCDLHSAEPNAPCLPEQECISFIEEGAGFPPWPEIGYCGIPLI